MEAILNSTAQSALRTAIVIGDGVVGMATAIELQRRGIATRLVAPAGGGRGASYGNAGHIAIEQVEPLASIATIRSFHRRLFSRGGALGLPPQFIGAWLPFALRMMRASTPWRFATGKSTLKAMLATAMPAWRRLVALADASDLLLENGHFVLWESQASAAAGVAHWKTADTGETTVRDATLEELERLRTLTTAPVAGAIRFVGSGQIADTSELATKLRAAFERLGGEWITGRVSTLSARPGGASAILDDGTRLDAEVAVVAAGAASTSLMGATGLRVPLIAERGYHIQTADTDWPADMPPVVFEDRSMIVTRFRSGLRAASFVEFGRLEGAPDRRKWTRLREHVARLGLSFREPADEWMGARPTLPDYLPAIGRSRKAPAICYAFGHQHLGLTLAATTAEAVGAMLCGEQPAFDCAALDLSRFGG